MNDPKQDAFPGCAVAIAFLLSSVGCDHEPTVYPASSDYQHPQTVGEMRERIESKLREEWRPYPPNTPEDDDDGQPLRLWRDFGLGRRLDLLSGEVFIPDDSGGWKRAIDPSMGPHKVEAWRYEALKTLARLEANNVGQEPRK